MLTTVPFTHRGLHDRACGRVENSLAAFDAAVSAGYGIELDVQLTSDDQAVVFHDYHLDRLTDQRGPIRNRSRRELSQINLTGAADRILGLDEVLDHVGGRVPVLVELKDQDGQMGPNVGGLETAVLAALDPYASSVAVMSFNPHSVKFMAERRPDLTCGLVTSDYPYVEWDLPRSVCDRLREIPDYQMSGASFISHEARDLDRPRVAELKAQGATVLCWTVRSQDAADRALKVADNITFEGFLPA